jgi:hypothetical protein
LTPFLSRPFSHEPERGRFFPGFFRSIGYNGKIFFWFTIYLVAGIVIALLFTGQRWAAWVSLAFSVLMIFISIFYYNPTIQIERQPGLLDWFEDLVFTGLLFVAAAQLLYALLVFGPA